MISKIYYFLRKIFFISFIIISIFSINFYEGSSLIYLIYCLIFILMFYYLTDNKASYFEIFLSTYLFLGFWFKYVFSLILFNGRVFDSGQNRSTNIDDILIIGIIIACILLFSSFINKKIINKKIYFQQKIKKTNFFEIFYLENKYKTLFSFLLIVFFIGMINLKYGIYQRGFIPVTETNFLIQNTIKWLLLFGFTTFSCFIINVEILNKKKVSYLTFLISIFEIFISYSSMLSRIFVINASSLLLPLYQKISSLKKKYDKFFFLFIIIIFILTLVSMFFVNDYRLSKLDLIKSNLIKSESLNSKTKNNEFKSKELKKIEEFNFQVLTHNKHKKGKITSNDVTMFILVNRWIGIDSLILVHSSNKTSFELFRNAFKETKMKNQLTFYEKTFNLEKYILQSNKEFLKGNTLPGFVTFLYYPGNLFFLAISILMVITTFNIFEKYLINNSNNNLIYVCFISNIIATRLIHFGYAPKDSYLFLTSIFLSILFLLILNNSIFPSVNKNK